MLCSQPVSQPAYKWLNSVTAGVNVLMKKLKMFLQMRRDDPVYFTSTVSGIIVTFVTD